MPTSSRRSTISSSRRASSSRECEPAGIAVPFHGYSTEFRQHRPYRVGDDLKYLDWKLFARSDRLYTRQFRETTNLSVLFALDTSASMDYPERGVIEVPLRPDRRRGARVSRVGAGPRRRADDIGRRSSCRTCRRAADACICARCSRASTSWRRPADGTHRASSHAARSLLERRGVVLVAVRFL